MPDPVRFDIIVVDGTPFGDDFEYNNDKLIFLGKVVSATAESEEIAEVLEQLGSALTGVVLPIAQADVLNLGDTFDTKANVSDVETLLRLIVLNADIIECIEDPDLIISAE